MGSLAQELPFAPASKNAIFKGPRDTVVAAACERGLEVALDYALQCSPDHPWVAEHPEWFHHRPDGTLRYAENPPKKYQDIYPLAFWPRTADGRDDETARSALWEACLEIFEHWIAHGIRVFRVDNPHTKPVAFWAWVIDRLRRDHPDVVLLAEAFTTPKPMHKLGEVGFTQSYSYFTWRHTRDELRDYLQELAAAPSADEMRPNFWPNTPDILAGVLRGGGPAAFRLRAVLAAMLVPNWGIYSGYELCENVPASDDDTEYAESEKYQLRTRDWGRSDSLAPFIGLFGTVWGIMLSFQGIGAAGSSSLGVVAPGIAEALVATAAGLFAAIPAVYFYNHFTNRVKAFAAEMDDFSLEFLNISERNFT